MNFIDVAVSGSGDDARLTGAADWSIPLPVQTRAALGSENVHSLVAGFRPEHLDIGEPGPGLGSFRARADVVEYLGNSELLHLSAADKDLVAIVDSSHHVRPGDILDMVIPLEKLHLFDRDSGVAMTAGTLAASAA